MKKEPTRLGCKKIEKEKAAKSRARGVMEDQDCGVVIFG